MSEHSSEYYTIMGVIATLPEEDRKKVETAIEELETILDRQKADIGDAYLLALAAVGAKRP